MIEIEDLRKHYAGEPVPVLRGVSFRVEEGEMVALMGPSGSGKTTVLNILGGLDTNYTGNVFVGGERLHGLSDEGLSGYRGRAVGFVFQSFNLLEHLSVAENVEMPTHFTSAPLGAEDRRVRTRICLEAVGLEHKIDHSPRLLSGGERQRVAIARSLFNKPKLLLCDEPTGALDSVSGKVIMDVFKKLNEEKGVTILLVTHDAGVGALATRVIRIDDGQLVSEENQ